MQIRRFTALLAGLGLVAGALFVGAPAGASNRDPDVIPGAWIVTLKDSASPAKVANQHGRRHGAKVDHVYKHAGKGYAARMSETAAQRVSRDSRVLRVEADRVVRAFGKPHSSSTSTGSQSVPTGIKRAKADQTDVFPIADRAVDVDVAIIDTGILSTHSDLNVAGGHNCSTGSSWEDGNGHGTHVAGTVAAKNDGSGVIGVVPGARVWAVRVLDNNGSGSWSSVQCGIDWVTGQKEADGETPVIEVANMSLGGSSSENDSSCGSSSLHQSICDSVNAGVTYAVAAGNSTADAKNYVPAKYDEVITVSALADSNGEYDALAAPFTTCRTDQEDTLADFSNFGADVDVIAPGVCINSTWKDGGYKTISGTSMAAPHVAGAAALYKVDNPAASPAAILSWVEGLPDVAWNSVDDPDLIKEPVLDVDALKGTNRAPTAATTATCTDLSCSFSATAVDPDNSTETFTYTWAYGGNGTVTSDATAAPSFTYADAGTYTVVATVRDSVGARAFAVTTVSVSTSTGDGGTGDGGTSEPAASVTLSVTGYKVKGWQKADLAWSGATTMAVDIYRNGVAVLPGTENDGAYTDNIKSKGGGSYTYKVCETGGGECSPERTVTF